MPFFIDQKAKTDFGLEDLVEYIEVEANRYLEHTGKFTEIGYVFLKSVLYIEDLIIGINQVIYDDAPKDRPLGYHMSRIRIIKNCQQLNNSLELLNTIKIYRNKIAHSLTYKTEEDPDFLKTFNIISSDNIVERKHKIAIHFKNMIEGFLYIKIGLEHIDKFVYFVNK